MTKATGTTNHTKAAKLIKAYASASLANFGEDENPDALTRAAIDEESDFVVCKIGEAMLLRHDYLADAAFRFGGDQYPDDLAEIASSLNWEA